MPLIHILCLLIKISEREKLNKLQPCFAKLPASKNGGGGGGERRGNKFSQSQAISYMNEICTEIWEIFPSKILGFLFTFLFSVKYFWLRIVRKT